MSKRYVLILLTVVLAVVTLAQDEDLAEAQRCNPEAPEYQELAAYEQTEGESDFIEGAFAITTIFVNDDGQRFSIEVSGASPEVVIDFSQKALVCFETIPLEIEPVESSEGFIGEEALLEQLVEETGIDLSELSAIRNEIFAENEDYTFFDLLDEFASDPDRILQYADEFGIDREQLEEPGIPFVVDPAELPDNESDYFDIIQRQPDAVIVTFELLDATDEPVVIAYAIDPDIGRYQSHYYRAKCQSSAWVQIQANAGSMSVYFWRYSPYVYLGARTANSLRLASPSHIYSSTHPSVKTFDVRVRGWQSNSNYSIFGYWSLGFGGSCN